jgi:hypothetical protein
MSTQDEVSAYWADFLAKQIEDEQRRTDAKVTGRVYEPGHNYGDRSVWRPVDPDDPWGDMVNRDGYTPDGRLLFPKKGAA